jgi:hypothetical protein
VRKLFIAALVLQIFAVSITKADFFPFITLPKELPNLQHIGNISSFVFIQEDKKDVCYVLAEALTKDEGIAPVILKKKISDTGEWEYIETNISVSTMLLFKKAITLKPLLLGKIGSQVALVARKNSFSAPDIYLYDHSKKIWHLFYDSSQKNSFITRGLNDQIPWLTGSDKTWWIKTCDLLNKCTVFENTKETRYIAASVTIVTADNQYAWLIESSKLSIRDLTDEEEFTQEIDLPHTIPEIIQLVALDDKTAFFIGSTKNKLNTIINLYKLKLIYPKEDQENLTEGVKVEINVIQTPKELLHKNSQIGIYNGMLIISSGNQLYKYAPLKPLNITVKAEETNTTKEPEENKAVPIELDWQTPAPIEAATIQVPEPEPVQGKPITIEVPRETSWLSKAIATALIRTKNVTKAQEEVKANIIAQPSVMRAQQEPKTSAFQQFRNWLGSITARLWGTKTEFQKPSTFATTSDARKKLSGRPRRHDRNEPNIKRGPTGK